MPPRRALDPATRPATTGEAATGPAREAPHAGRPYILGSIHPATEELRELAGTLGLQLVTEFCQSRDRPHPGTFFGKGKLESLKTVVSDLKAGLRPPGWTWNGHEFVSADEDRGEETAWGGTGWARAHQDQEGLEDARPTGKTGEGKGDPLVSAGRGGAKGKRERTRNEGASEGRLRPAAVEASDAGPAPDLSRWAEQEYILILDEDVRPAVLFNLEERLGIEVWDRTRLILEIFTQHANVKEARLQVELAMLQYEIPLIHEAVHRRRAGERPGFMSGGDYEVADYEDFIKRRMRAVKDELEHIRQERKVRRKVRRERFYLVSLAGYTNAGKSSLLNALTGAEVLEKWEMFSTLQTTTRRMVESQELQRAALRISKEQDGENGEGQKVRPEGDEGKETFDAERASDPSRKGTQNVYTRPILLTDTVGFIQALPSWLLDAFRSTLEEIAVSDVVLLVADVSDPVDVLMEKVRVAREELSFMDVTSPVVLALSKTDLVPEQAVGLKRWRLEEAGLAREDLTVSVSAKDLAGVDDLVALIQEVLPAMIPYEARLPMADPGQRLLSLLYSWGEVQDVDYGKDITVRGRCDPLHWKTLLREAVSIDAEVSRLSERRA